MLADFELLKELGLLALSAPNELTTDLESFIKEAFSLQSDPSSDVTAGKETSRIATYYQDGALFHDSGTGDGRSLWLGEVQITDWRTGRETNYDISTKGTGVTGLGWDTCPDHYDGLSDLGECLREYYGGQVMFRGGISDSSRVLAVLDLGFERKLSDGSIKRAGIIVRVSPTNLRFAHLWKHRLDTDALTLLLRYHFRRTAEYRDQPFEVSATSLMLDNIRASAREQAIFENLNLSQSSPTRGNRLLNGRLTDFSTLQFFDAWYSGLFYRRNLGTLAEQKHFSLHWNHELHRIGLDRVLPPGLSAAVDELDGAFESLRALETHELHRFDGHQLRLPRLDLRKLHRSLPIMEILNRAKTFDSSDILSRWGWPDRGPGDDDALMLAWSRMETALRRIVEELSVRQGVAASAVATRLESIAADRNRGRRYPGAEPRFGQLRVFEQWAHTVSPNEFKDRIDRQVEIHLDFGLDPGILPASTPGALAHCYQRLAEPTESTKQDAPFPVGLLPGNPVDSGLLLVRLERSCLNHPGRKLIAALVDRAWKVDSHAARSRLIMEAILRFPDLQTTLVGQSSTQDVDDRDPIGGSVDDACMTNLRLRVEDFLSGPDWRQHLESIGWSDLASDREHARVELIAPSIRDRVLESIRGPHRHIIFRIYPQNLPAELPAVATVGLILTSTETPRSDDASRARSPNA